VDPSQHARAKGRKAGGARVIGYLVVAYAALCIAVRLGYRILLYPVPNEPPPAVPLGSKLLSLRASDGASVHALQFPPPSDHARTIVLFHGNGETIASDVPLAQTLHRRGLGVVLAEYRGYGVSRESGKPSETGLYLDAEAVLDALKAQGIGADRTALMGVSLGTGVVAEMARRGRAAALILVSPYTSITAMARRTAPFLPVSWVCPDAFDTLSKARMIGVPTLVIHGDEDEVVPFAMGRSVAAAVPGAALKVVPGGHHNDLFVRWHDALVDAVVAQASR
jgi:fermentation-respiration switch protein FrsA (DUF1100 family)